MAKGADLGPQSKLNVRERCSKRGVAGPTAERKQLHLDSDQRLDRRIVQVARDTRPLRGLGSRLKTTGLVKASQRRSDAVRNPLQQS